MTAARLRAVPAPDGIDERYTIDELARETGLTVRNIRNHQSRGLLPPPEVIGRTGYYGRHHVERLNLVRQMQSEGFNLEAIRRLLGEEGDALLKRFRRAVSTPVRPESPEVVTLDELTELFGRPDARTLRQCERLGVLVPLGGGRFEVPSPSLLGAAQVAVERGIDIALALEAVKNVRRNCQSSARTFVQLFLEELWKPVRDADPDERWPEVAEAIEALRPVAADVVAALFKQTMDAEVERAFAHELERLSRGRR